MRPQGRPLDPPQPSDTTAEGKESPKKDVHGAAPPLTSVGRRSPRGPWASLVTYDQASNQSPERILRDAALRQKCPKLDLICSRRWRRPAPSRPLVENENAIPGAETDVDLQE